MKNFIAESVTFMHPDKICDQISDALLDAYLAQDPTSRVAIETAGGHGHVGIFGEITSKADVDIKTEVKKFYKKLTGKDIDVAVYVSKQSPEIAAGVNTGGAGDQGIMVGYACSENALFMPQEMYLCRKLLDGVQTDAKSQVVIMDGKIQSIVLSVQGKDKNELSAHVKKLKIADKKTELFLNNCGSFDIGGFDADSGCTGRKIVVDAYGPRVPVGGGAFSGKDPSKVDRSAAYMARWVALQILKEKGAKEVLVKIGYVIGSADPVIKQAIIDGTETTFEYDCRPEAIIEQFNLRSPIYLQTAKDGHFGHINKYPWEMIK